MIECTHAENYGSKSVKSLIDKIRGLQEGAHKAIQKHYGRDKKFKVKWGLATKDINWRQADLDRAEESKIAVISDDEIEYFEKLSAHLKGAAKYQFFGKYFMG